MSSLTWQFLPPWLLDPVMHEAISLAEAAELWDCVLMSGGGWLLPPPHLQPLLRRLQHLQFLQALDPHGATQH